ncbi:MAG: hypothetical protein AUJ98_07790 [Bacteroidetes bacterium CG2_30_33_31]|nr:MAG: hypothetical protein AUJ98_07790 [Bacteroidetes bacterium CG2_30_33_31]
MMANVTVKAEDFFSRNYGTDFYKKIARPIIVAINLKSPSNIGGIIRLADNIGCIKVIFIGDKSQFKQSKIKKSSTTAFNKISWEFCKSDEWLEKIPIEYQIIAVETASNSKNLYSTIFPEKVAFVFGNENYGLDQENLSLCHSSIYIPIPGSTLSLNVVQSTSIVLFEWFRQMSNLHSLH